MRNRNPYPATHLLLAVLNQGETCSKALQIKPNFKDESLFLHYSIQKLIALFL